MDRHNQGREQARRDERARRPAAGLPASNFVRRHGFPFRIYQHDIEYRISFIDMGRAVKRKYDSSRRREQAEVTRHEIASAARRLFALNGYAATTLAAIAAEAGVAEPTVYAVFGAKKGFLLALRQ